MKKNIRNKLWYEARRKTALDLQEKTGASSDGELIRQWNASNAIVGKYGGISWRTMTRWNQNDEWKEKKSALRFGRRLGPRPSVPDFVTFRKKYLGRDTYPHQLEWLKAIEEERFVMILQPRRHGKTTFMEDFAIWLICMNPAVQIVFISKSQLEARKRLRRIKSMLTHRGDGDNIPDTFGPFKPSRDESHFPWTQDEIYVAGSDPDNRDPTVAALGVSTTIYGQHPDVVILDDVATLDNQGPSEREKQVAWLDQEVYGGLTDEKDARLIIIGTRIQEEDLYLMLQESFFDPEAVLIQPAILDEEKQRVLCPQLVSYEELQRRRKRMGERSFALIYQQSTTGMPDAPFPKEWLDAAKDPNFTLGEVRPGWRLFMGVDPAVYGPSCVVVLALDTAGHRWIVDCQIRENLRSHDALGQWIREAAHKYKIRHICVEKASQQEGYWNTQSFKEIIYDLGAEFLVGNVYEKYKPDVGVGSLGDLFEKKMIHLPWSDESQYTMRQYVAEFAIWRPHGHTRGAHEDRVMATWYADLGARRFIGFSDEGFEAHSMAPRWAKNRGGLPGWAKRRYAQRQREHERTLGH